MASSKAGGLSLISMRCTVTLTEHACPLGSDTEATKLCTAIFSRSSFLMVLITPSERGQRLTKLHCVTLHNTVLYCITLHYTVLHCITLYYTVLHCITPHYTALHCITLYYIVLHCISLYYTALHCITLYYTALHRITLYYIVLHCISLYYTALHCITLYYTALHRITLYFTMNFLIRYRNSTSDILNYYLWRYIILNNDYFNELLITMQFPHPDTLNTHKQ